MPEVDLMNMGIFHNNQNQPIEFHFHGNVNLQSPAISAGATAFSSITPTYPVSEVDLITHQIHTGKDCVQEKTKEYLL